MSHSEAMFDRLTSLERSVRRLRAAVVVAVGALAVAVIGAAGSGPETVKAKRLEIVSPKGDTRAVLGQNARNGELLIYDTTGAVVARLPKKAKPPKPPKEPNKDDR